MFGQIALCIACVQGCCRFKQHDAYFFDCNGSVFYSFGNYQKFVLFHYNCFVPILHFETSFYDKKEFVFVVVLMPNKLAFEFNELYMLSIQFSYYFW